MSEDLVEDFPIDPGQIAKISLRDLGSLCLVVHEISEDGQLSFLIHVAVQDLIELLEGRLLIRRMIEGPPFPGGVPHERQELGPLRVEVDLGQALADDL